jgi:hypothetical protein
MFDLEELERRLDGFANWQNAEFHGLKISNF